MDGEALQNVATCRAVLHNCFAEVRRSFSDTINSAADFDVDVAVIDHGQTEDTVSNQAFENNTETGDTKNWLRGTSIIRICRLVEMR